MKHKIGTFFIFLFSFFICTCNLFNPPNDDYWEKIEEEIRWANAEKIQVDVVTQQNTGQARWPDKFGEIRKGYEFTVEFISTGDVRLDTWIALAGTVDISGKTAAELKDEAYDLDEVDKDKISITDDKSPTGSDLANVTIYIPGPITLVPLCTDEPEIIGTYPTELSDGKEGYKYPPFRNDQDFTFYFASRLDSSTVDFGEKAISITMQDIDENGDGEDASRYFRKPRWDNGQRAIILEPGNTLPPENKLFTITFGTEIRGSLFSTPLDEAVSFSWIIGNSEDKVSMKSWEAKFPDADFGDITVSWEYEDKIAPNDTRAYYRIDNGPPTNIDFSGNSDKQIEISSVQAINTKDVRQGNIERAKRFDVYLEYIDSADRVFKTEGPLSIWNVPGMSVNASNTVYINEQLKMSNEQIRELFEDEGISNIVLTSNITLENWNPVSFSDKKFYGNGHTVTISSMNAAADTGLFGVVNGGTVRDLTVNYETAEYDAETGWAVTINPTTAAQFGGIAGTAAGKAEFINVLVKGAATFNVSGDTTAYVGGLVGQLGNAADDTASIYNAYGSLNLTVETASTREADGAIYVGGITGSMGSTSNGSCVSVEEASVVGNITVTASGPLNVGGITGYMRGNTGGDAVLKNSSYMQGTITVSIGTGVSNIGGAVGTTYGDVAIDSCFSRQGGFTISRTGRGEFNTGGFIGNFQIGLNSSLPGTIRNSYSVGDVNVSAGESSTSAVYAGGFAGRIAADIEYCYATGNVSAFGYNFVYAGGFAGLFVTTGNVEAQYCYAAGDVSAIFKGTAEAILYAGGFVGDGSSGELSNCYATGNVFADRLGTAQLFVGGLVGQINSNGKISNCFATGSVIAQRSGSMGSINAGGLAGNALLTAPVANSAALGSSVTATGGSTRYVGRVFGNNVTGGKSNNHANNSMRLYSDSTYNADEPSSYTPTPTPADNNRNGADADINDDFKNHWFWRDTMRFNPDVWLFTTVAERGYPILRGPNVNFVPGSALGGQEQGVIVGTPAKETITLPDNTKVTFDTWQRLRS